MSDAELINIYNLEYIKEFDHNYAVVNSFYDKAKDKKYAIKMGFGVASMLYAFRNGTLDKKITDTYEHMDKLGYSIATVIRSVPETIFAFEQEEKYRILKEQKNQWITVKKLRWGIFPYNEKIYNKKKREIKIGSAFENLTALGDIAAAFGKQRAIIDVYENYKSKFFESGGLAEIETEEVKQYKLIADQYQTLLNLKSSLATNDLDNFFKIFQGLFASLPYDVKITEGYFHSLIHTILALLDCMINSEVETNAGRIDMVSETDYFIHIFEFKLDSCDIALQQILDKKYYQKYLNSEKQIILVGVAMDKKNKNITNWKSVRLDQLLKSN